MSRPGGEYRRLSDSRCSGGAIWYIGYRRASFRHTCHPSHCQLAIHQSEGEGRGARDAVINGRGSLVSAPLSSFCGTSHSPLRASRNTPFRIRPVGPSDAKSSLNNTASLEDLVAPTWCLKSSRSAETSLVPVVEQCMQGEEAAFASISFRRGVRDVVTVQSGELRRQKTGAL